MFDSTLNPLWQRYILAVQEEVKPALGCTEPISLALAAAVAAAELEGPVERVEAWVSPNLMKNGLGVTVPGTGMVGLPIAAALGALGGNANAGLEVLKDATAQAIADAKALLAAGKVSVKIQEPCNEILFSRAKVWNGEKWACVTIVGGHTNIVHIETHNGVVFTQQACVAEGEQESPLTVLSRTTLAEILKFVNEVPFAAIRFILAAQFISGDGAAWVKVVSVILNIFAVMTAFFGVYLGFREATQGIVMNILRRKMPAEKINENLVQRGIMIFAILLAWSAIVLNAPVLSFTSICSPIFGMVGCLIPAWLVYKVPALHKYKGMSLYLIIVTGLLLCVSPFLAFS